MFRAEIKNPAQIKSCFCDARTQVEGILFQISMTAAVQTRNKIFSFQTRFFRILTFERPSFLTSKQIWQRRFCFALRSGSTAAEKSSKKFVRKKLPKMLSEHPDFGSRPKIRIFCSEIVPAFAQRLLSEIQFARSASKCQTRFFS